MNWKPAAAAEAVWEEIKPSSADITLTPHTLTTRLSATSLQWSSSAALPVCLYTHTHTICQCPLDQGHTHTSTIIIPDRWETDVLLSTQTITTALKNNNQPDSKSIYMTLTYKTVYSVENINFISIPTPYFLLIYRRYKKSHEWMLFFCRTETSY